MMLMWKDKTTAFIDGIRNQLIAISDEIHRNPELAFKEFKAAQLLIAELKKAGYVLTIAEAIGTLLEMPVFSQEGEGVL